MSMVSMFRKFNKNKENQDENVAQSHDLLINPSQRPPGPFTPQPVNLSLPKILGKRKPRHNKASNARKNKFKQP